MSERSLRVVGFGLIGVDKQNEPYRQVIFKEDDTSASAELLVRKKERPLLWADIEKLEKGGKLPPYRGYITKLNSMDVVVFDGESIDDAFSRQKTQLNVKSRITYEEAEVMREKSFGYKTNLTSDAGMEIAWRSIQPDSSIVKFRDYAGNGKFVWGNWYEIVNREKQQVIRNME